MMPCNGEEPSKKKPAATAGFVSYDVYGLR